MCCSEHGFAEIFTQHNPPLVFLSHKWRLTLGLKETVFSVFCSFFRGKSFRSITLSLRPLCHNLPRKTWWLALSCRGHNPSPLGLGREWATYETGTYPALQVPSSALAAPLAYSVPGCPGLTCFPEAPACPVQEPGVAVLGPVMTPYPGPSSVPWGPCASLPSCPVGGTDSRTGPCGHWRRLCLWAFGRQPT